MKKVFAIILFIFVLMLVYTFSGDNLISSKDAREQIKNGEFPQIIDVRTKMEYNAGHYPGAINIPVLSINEETTKNLLNRRTLVYCNTGQRARFASKKLNELGFSEVYYIAGTYGSLF